MKQSRIIYVAAIVIPIAVLGFILFSARNSSETSGTLLVEQGTVTVETQSGRGQPNELAAGEQYALSAGDNITVDDVSLATVVLSDGSRIELEADSELNILELETDSTEDYVVRLELLAGLMVNRVEALLGANGTYEVITPSSTATVRGTVFTIEILDDTTSQISVDEGVVGVSETETGDQVELTVGQTALVVRGAAYRGRRWQGDRNGFFSFVEHFRSR